MQTWVVELTARPARGRRFSVDDADELLSLLAACDPVIELGPGSLEASLTVEASDVSQAVMRAYHFLREGLMEAGLDPDVPIGRVEAFPQSELRVRGEDPAPSDLLGVSELASLLGVSRQRASQLADEPWFPTPIAELASGPIWDKGAIEVARAEWDRRPGRPKKVRAR